MVLSLPQQECPTLCVLCFKEKGTLIVIMIPPWRQRGIHESDKTEAMANCNKSILKEWWVSKVEKWIRVRYGHGKKLKNRNWDCIFSRKKLFFKKWESLRGFSHNRIWNPGRIFKMLDNEISLYVVENIQWKTKCFESEKTTARTQYLIR